MFLKKKKKNAENKIKMQANIQSKKYNPEQRQTPEPPHSKTKRIAK